MAYPHLLYALSSDSDSTVDSSESDPDKHELQVPVKTDNTLDIRCFRYSTYDFLNETTLNAEITDLETALRNDRPDGVIQYFLKHPQQSINTKNSKGVPLLHIAIVMKAPKIFQYLLSVPSIDLNLGLTKSNQTPLMCAAKLRHFDFFTELVKRGASLNKQNFRGSTALHYAIKRGTVEIVEFLLEHGADVNNRNMNGKTPLHLATSRNKYGMVALLLFYGADATNCRKDEMSPLDIAISNKFVEIEELMCNYLFDTNSNGASLKELKVSTFMLAILKDSAMFPKMLESCTTNYDSSVFEYLTENLISMNPDLLKMFGHKFPHILEKFVVRCGGALAIFLERVDNFVDWGMANFLMLLETVPSPDLIWYCQRDVVCFLISYFGENKLNLEKLTNLVCIYLCSGYDVTFGAIDECYIHFGHCELFDILLHMDIKENSNKPNRTRQQIMARFHCDMSMCIEKVLSEFHNFSRDTLSDVLDYFSHHILTSVCLNSLFNGGKIVVQKAAKLPRVPSLLELSRNASRKQIILEFGIKNSCQFHSVINHLPIPLVYKNILCYRQKLY